MNIQECLIPPELSENKVLPVRNLQVKIRLTNFEKGYSLNLSDQACQT